MDCLEALHASWFSMVIHPQEMFAAKTLLQQNFVFKSNFHVAISCLGLRSAIMNFDD